MEPFFPDGCGWQHRAAQLDTSSRNSAVPKGSTLMHDELSAIGMNEKLTADRRVLRARVAEGTFRNPR